MGWCRDQKKKEEERIALLLKELNIPRVSKYEVEEREKPNQELTEQPLEEIEDEREEHQIDQEPQTQQE